MPNYDKSIVVDGNGFREIMTDFNSLVADKFFKPVPYKDYTRLRKFNKEVEFRFCSSDGAVMILPTEVGLSLLYWTKKGDNSLGDFLWGHFQEELKDMHPDEKKYEYDLYGLASKADYASADYDNCSVSALVSNIANTYADKVSLGGVCSASESAKVTATDWNSTQTNVATISTDGWQPTWKIQDEVIDGKIAELKEEIAVKTKQLEEKILTRPSFEEMDYRDHCITDDVLSVVDETRSDVLELYEEIEDIKKWLKEQKEMKVKEAAEDKKMPCVVYDMYGMPHEVQGTLQSTSSNCYPHKNYKIDLAGYGIDNGKEKESMDTAKMFNFDFGPVASHIRMSPYGLAMKNADGKYVSYDKNSGSVMDVEIFNFDAQKFLYKMPVAVSQVAVGDIVVHMRKPMFVRAVKDGVVSVIDIYNAEAKDILPVKSPFGFNFITKVVSLIDMTGANDNSPFGNMLPLLMLGEGQDMKNILPLMFFANGNNANMMNNPLMMYALLNDTNNVDSLGIFLALSAGMGGNNPFAPAAPAHNCGCHNHNEGQCNNG